ncbi:zf-HC2 domain-containing protein [Streptomyces sp. NBC_01498]|uniref:anti-sigma factor family protein n=1 Tax=Streptomyces sp. NBC_01498 TaxID=2975870 RepID=UPI002E7C1F96|nr:zf-HC2 domain-containing protein [Streptomyces sp. NBC_01498]WTL25889.1 zf-HC2 domain-containing protein [Streptomyces sp. NBC_01498]
MTATTGTTEHPDVSELSDLTEGLLSPERSTEVRGHLDGCPSCAEVYASLEEIRELLGSLPGAPRMPADVAARIDAALAAETLPSTSTPASTPVSVPPAVSEHEPFDADASSDVSRETTRVGATVADTPRADRPAGRPRAATGPGRTRPARRRRGAIFGAVFGTAAIGVSVLLFQTMSSSTDDTQSSYKADAGSSLADRGVGAFSGSEIRDKVRTLLASTPATGEPRAADEGSSPLDGPTVQTSPKVMAQLPPCVQQGTGRTDIPLAAERGTYEGMEAFLVVLSDPNDGSMVQAYVIDAACVNATPPVKGELLLTQALPRR